MGSGYFHDPKRKKTINKMKRCTQCEEEKEADVFGPHLTWCRSCKALHAAKKRREAGVKKRNLTVLNVLTKQCADCKEYKLHENFCKASRGRGGLSAYCAVCLKKRYYDKDKARVAAYKYRERNRAKWLAGQRLHQFNRKALIKASDDGTVTDVFLEELYSAEKCHYCRKYTPYKMRTADHKIPLSRKGLHSADNLVMACGPCNSSKGAKTEEEYKCLLKQK